MQILSDRFDTDVARGKVVGRQDPIGIMRSGVDLEGVVSIDNGALRIQPLIKAGWERACLSYGPFKREPGLVMSVFMINGHNTSQAEAIPESFRDRMDNWFYGSGVFGGRLERLKRLLVAGGRLGRIIRKIRWWRAISECEVPTLDENLAVGWFPDPVSNPLDAGSGFVMHATGHECGELWIRAQETLMPVVSSMQNIQVYYVVALRENDAIYYVSSIPDANGLSAYPELRPVGIDAGPLTPEVWASIHQSVLGQIGFRLDTRVYGVTVGRDENWMRWAGGAHFADSLRGLGDLGRSEPETGSAWRSLSGRIERTEAGATTQNTGAVTASPSSHTGLLRCLIEFAGSAIGRASLRWRQVSDVSYWSLDVLQNKIQLVLTMSGNREVVAATEELRQGEIELQIIDSGTAFGVYANGVQLFGRMINDDRLSDGTDLGFALSGDSAAVVISNFEAHPRSVTIPKYLDHGAPWFREGDRVIVSDKFENSAGELEDTVTTTGEKSWRRLCGAGKFQRNGNGALQVVATRESPCPGRTMYGIDWDYDDFVDVEVTITPPGTARGQRENGISGIVIWQDEDNYITVNSWVSDGYDGASISCFFNIRGWEDVYDAIWSNVGARIQHGKAYKMRVIADSKQYVVRVDGEPVVYRAFRDVYSDCDPLKITSVGLITNWEWGLDTGSVFRDFNVRR